MKFCSNNLIIEATLKRNPQLFQQFGFNANMVDARNHQQRFQGGSAAYPDIYLRTENLRPPQHFDALRSHRNTVSQKVTGLPFDVYRDSGVRYMGFTNEVAVASNSLTKVTSAASKAARAATRMSHSFFKDNALLGIGWGISLVYGVMDAFSKGKKASQTALKQGQSELRASRHKKAKIGETLLFHSMASWVLPTFVIMAAHKLAHGVLHAVKASPKLMKWGPVAAGLGIIYPMTKVLDPWAEKVLHKYVEPRLQRWIDKAP